MKVGILGLGLIGGSLARAYALEGHTVYAIQRCFPAQFMDGWMKPPSRSVT